jgi:microcystin-dependent protein
MSDGFDGMIGEIKLFAGNFPPRNWAFCDGQLMAISQFSALFSLLGTNYGGDGRQSFALPDLRGRVAVHPGTGPGLSPRAIGERYGTEHASLNVAHLPAHSHKLQIANLTAESDRPSGERMLARSTSFAGADATTASVALYEKTIAAEGGGAPHDNIQPSLGVNYIICLYGIFPSRS